MSDDNAVFVAYWEEFVKLLVADCDASAGNSGLFQRFLTAVLATSPSSGSATQKRDGVNPVPVPVLGLGLGLGLGSSGPIPVMSKRKLPAPVRREWSAYQQERSARLKQQSGTPIRIDSVFTLQIFCAEYVVPYLETIDLWTESGGRRRLPPALQNQCPDYDPKRLARRIGEIANALWKRQTESERAQVKPPTPPTLPTGTVAVHDAIVYFVQVRDWCNEQSKADKANPLTAEGAGGGKWDALPKPKRGRPKRFDWRADRKVADAWNTGQYRDHKHLGVALNMQKAEVVAALDRDRKRRKTRRKNP